MADKQWEPAPGPKQSEFDALNTQVQGIADHIANYEAGTTIAVTAGTGTSIFTLERAVLKNGVVQINGYFVRNSSFAKNEVIMIIPPAYVPPVSRLREFVFSTDNDIFVNVNILNSGNVTIDTAFPSAIGKYMMFNFVYPI